MKTAFVLLIETDPVQRANMCELLTRQGMRVGMAERADEALDMLQQDPFNLVLLSLDIADLDGLAFIRRIQDGPNHPEVVAYTGRGSINNAVEAMRAGAYDFLLLPVAPERLLTTLRNALAHVELMTTVAEYRKVDRHGFEGFIGSSPAMHAVYRMIESAASSKATAFITGESGTGKEVCASAIHRLSPRGSGPFVALNCAAIPKDLIESEVFGHVKGAFTGATSDRDGAARQANGGTLFLDEICEMDLNLQSKLLRFLQTGSFQRVGGSKLEEVDVRIVCATNRDPLAEVKAGRFREDLYYRLHVIPISMPALRDREGDVVEIANHLLSLYTKEERKKFTRFSPEVERMLQNYDWPGNVRQLQNVIRNIVVMHDGPEVVPEMVPPPVGGRWARPHGFGGEPTPGHGALPPAYGTSSALAAIRPLAVVEREAIEAAIAACDGNVPKAAALLDVSPSTLYRKRQGWEESTR